MSARCADRDARRRPTELAFVAASVGAAVFLTWPLVTVFGSRICGDTGDPYQTLWGMRWMRDALVALRNPFFTDRVYWPTGSTLVFQTFDLPSTLAAVPLWDRVPDVAIYNSAVLLAVALTVYGMFRLVREATGDAWVGLAAGVMFAAVPYRLAHMRGHLHLLAMGWLPLFLVHLRRLTLGTATARDGALGGLFLALATLASWYHLLYAAVLVAVLVGHALATRFRTVMSRQTLAAVAILVTVWLALVGPLLIAMLAARAAGPITGTHDASEFSADLYAFFLPNAAQRWRDVLGSRYREWSGNPTENAAYLGYAMLGLAVWGAWRRKEARPFLAAAAAGAVLALGPALRADGRVLDVELPYAVIERMLPLVGLAGVPVRFGYVAYFGLVVAAAFGLAALRARAASRGPVVAALAVVVPVALVLLEYWPQPLLTSTFGVPAPMRAWADDPTTFAVVDVWDSYRPMWHATIHRKPMVGGYLSRVPEVVDAPYQRHPVVRCILFGDGGETWTQRVDPTIDFDWGTRGPAATILPEHFDADWQGTLLAPVDGTYALELEADGQATVSIDDAPALRRIGGCATGGDCVARTALPLSAGRHRIRIGYRHRTGPARVRLWWRPPDGARTIVPAEALRTPGGRAGLAVEYRQSVVPSSGLGTERGREALRALDVRYVIINGGNRCVEEDLRLPLAYVGEDVRIYEVPPAASAGPSHGGG